MTEVGIKATISELSSRLQNGTLLPQQHRHQLRTCDIGSKDPRGPYDKAKVAESPLCGISYPTHPPTKSHSILSTHFQDDLRVMKRS